MRFGVRSQRARMATSRPLLRGSTMVVLFAVSVLTRMHAILALMFHNFSSNFDRFPGTSALFRVSADGSFNGPPSLASPGGAILGTTALCLAVAWLHRWADDARPTSPFLDASFFWFAALVLMGSIGILCAGWLA